MSCTRRFLIFTLLSLWPCTAQTDEDRRRLSEFQDRMRRGEPGKPDDALYIKQFNERQKVEFPKNHPARESTGMVPLHDLGKGTYQGNRADSIRTGRTCHPAHIAGPAMRSPRAYFRLTRTAASRRAARSS